MASTTRGPVIRRFPHAMKRLVSVVQAGGTDRGSPPPRVRRVELAGMMAGPFLYLQGRRNNR